jgi:hypothetical protein
MRYVFRFRRLAAGFQIPATYSADKQNEDAGNSLEPTKVSRKLTILLHGGRKSMISLARIC